MKESSTKNVFNLYAQFESSFEEAREKLEHPIKDYTQIR